MQFKELTLEDIRSYDEETIPFEDGANLIHGVNGAGKTTILQGVFGGLFQTNITKHLGDDFNLDNIVRKQSDEGRIILVFEEGGDDYTVEWRVKKRYDDDGEVDGAKTKPGYPQLTSPALDQDYSGFRDVQAEIQRIIGMDAESFVNSVYVQQGDISRLIHADTETRRKILDGLLGLNRLDELVNRMDEVRLEYKKAKRDANARLSETRNRLQELPDEDELSQQISTVADRIDDLTSDIEEHKETLDGLRDQKSDHEDTLEELGDIEDKLDEKRQELKDAKAEYEKHKSNLQEESNEKQDVIEALQEKRNTLAEKREREDVEEYDTSEKSTAEASLEQARSEAESARSTVQSIKEGRLSTLQTEITYLNEDITEKESDISDHNERISLAEDKRESAEQQKCEAEDQVAELESTISAKESEINTATAEIDGLPEDADLDALAEDHIPDAQENVAEEREDVRERIGRLETLQEQVDELESDGECPVCGSTEDSHDINPSAVADEHASDLEDARGRLSHLDEKRKALNDLGNRVQETISLRDELEEAREAVSEAEEEIAEAEEKKAEFEDNLEEAQDALEELNEELNEKRTEKEEAEADLAEAQDEAQAAEDVEERLETIVSLYADIDELETRKEQHDENIDNLGTLQKQARKQVKSLESDIDELQTELGEVSEDEIRAEIEEIEGYIDDYEEKKSVAEDERSEARDRLAALNQQKQQVTSEKERAEMLEEQVAWADNKVDEAKTVQHEYKEVRATLRQRSLARLNKYTNEMFRDLYQSQSYRGVQIDSQYNIHLVTADDELMEPELTSGGETTILNLALRAGVYRIIAERDGVAGAALPPLILDEPTTFLDDDHIGELQTMIDTVSDWDVPQVLVVSHDEQLIENSDTNIHVTKDPQTETSQVETNATGVVTQTPQPTSDD